MTYREEIMTDIENIVADTIAAKSEGRLREASQWLASLSEKDFQLSDQELGTIKKNLKLVQTKLKRIKQPQHAAWARKAGWKICI